MAPMMCSAVAGDDSIDTRIQLAQLSGDAGNSWTRLILLGTAGGPTWWPNSDQCGISSVVAVGDAYYVVDCGEGVGKRLQQAISPASSRVMDDKVRALFLTHLRDQLSIKGVRRVVLHEPLSNLRKVIFVQYERGTPRTEVWRGLHGAATLLADCGKICIAVSEDIDPTNTDAVFWSLAYRSNPIEDVHIAPHRSAGHGPKSGPRSEESTILIDATLKHSAPPLALPTREFMERAQTIWQELKLPALTPQPPWHGYSLGDWSENWSAYAERAVAGKWEQTGEETFARRRGGLIPETPVREVEGKDSKD